MNTFKGRTAVITGAGSGFGLEASRIAAREGMNVVMADVQQDALTKAAAEVEALGAKVLPFRLDVSKAAEVEALGAAAFAKFGAPHFVFNNAGVGTNGLCWEQTARDWEWVFGVNVMGVAHGVRVFTPIMLAQNEPAHIVNTASVAGLLSPPAMGAYNASKHAVVSLTETLYHDLQLVQGAQGVQGVQASNGLVGCSLLCPAFVPTGIADAERARPADLRNDSRPTRSQIAAGKQLHRAVQAGKLSAADVADITFDAIAARRFYIVTHPGIMATVKLRHEDIEQLRAPTDPMSLKPEVKSAG